METSNRYVTAYNYADNSPPYTDFVARGRHVTDGNARADIGRNDFSLPTSVSLSPEAGAAYGSRIFIDGYGWFLNEDSTQAGLANAPRFDLWTAGATADELATLTGWFDVTIFAPSEKVPPAWKQKTAGQNWHYSLWTSPARLVAMRDGSANWQGIYREGILLT
ncbi:MAG TPA: hypothetical protein VGM54_19345 [Chthoniobacter sp.]|jgi:hypothetical protein